MIQEEYVAFETAKLLKEAGYPQDEIRMFWVNGKEIWGTPIVDEKGVYSRPTQSCAMRWLREDKKIGIATIEAPDGIFGKWRYGIYDRINEECILLSDERSNSYEKVAEAGIKTACEYLLNHT